MTLKEFMQAIGIWEGVPTHMWDMPLKVDDGSNLDADEPWPKVVGVEVHDHFLGGNGGWISIHTENS